MSRVVVVGIGASAGGLEALQELISNLPSKSNMAYIIALHQSPTHKSILVELLAKVSPIEVIEAANGMKIEPSKIYVTPPSHQIFLSEDSIVLKTLTEKTLNPSPSIDQFFTSLAHDKKQDAIGVILSGTGSDGNSGCGEIRAEGGIAIAQDPKEAKFDGMPSSAIRARQIDIVLPASEIGAELYRIEKYISGEINIEHIVPTPKTLMSRYLRCSKRRTAWTSPATS